MGVADEAGIGVRVRVRVDMCSYCPPLEVGTDTLVSGTSRGELSGLGGDNVGVTVGRVFAGCGHLLASHTNLVDGASIGSGPGTSLGDCGDGEQAFHCSNNSW